MSGASKSTVAFLVLLVLSLIGTAGFFFVKSRKKSQSVVQYNTMINDTDGDVEPIDPGTPAATFRIVLPVVNPPPPAHLQPATIKLKFTKDPARIVKLFHQV